MAKQPRARQAKSKSRQDAFHVLSDKAKSGPKKDTKISFGDVQMTRQGKKVLVMKVCTATSTCCHGRVLSQSCEVAVCRNLPESVDAHRQSLHRCILLSRHVLQGDLPAGFTSDMPS